MKNTLYQYYKYINSIINYCKTNNIEIIQYDSIQKFIIDDNLTYIDHGEEALIFIKQHKIAMNSSVVYKIYNMNRYYYLNRQFNKEYISIFDRFNILNAEFKKNFYQKLHRCIVINNEKCYQNVYIVYTQKYITDNYDKNNLKIIVNELNKLLKTNFFTVENIQTNHNFIYRTKSNLQISNFDMCNLTLDDNNELFIYDLDVYI